MSDDSSSHAFVMNESGAPDGVVVRRRVSVRVSSDAIDEDASETIDGLPVTDQQIGAWAAEAEAGYDVGALKKRGRGRPERGVEPSQIVALRLTADEIADLDERAARRWTTRSDIIRKALAAAPA